jgi:hypothetical protein
MSPITTLPRRAVEGALTVTRLPLTAVETITRRRGRDWAPALAFSTVEANVLQLAAGVLHDEALAEHGRRVAEATTRRQEALDLEAAADAVERRAQQQRDATVEQAEAAVDKTRDAAQEAVAESEESAAQRVEQVRAAAAKRRQSVQKAAAQREKGRQRAQRAETLAVLDERADATEAAAEAVDAKKAAVEAAEQVDELKQARRARSS